MIKILVALVAVGCGQSEFALAPVAGTITLDDKPLANATIVFYPEPVGDVANPGPASFGKTDENGSYSATTVRGDEGAVVGPHRVTISTLQLEDEGGIRQREVVPPKYNERSDLNLDVPAEGTDRADFTLQSN